MSDKAFAPIRHRSHHFHCPCLHNTYRHSWAFRRRRHNRLCLGQRLELQKLASEAEDRLFIAAEADRKDRETARLSQIIERKKVVRQTALKSDKEDMEALVFIISELL